MSALAANDSEEEEDVVILVVEDQILVRFDVADCLEEAGYVVIQAASGEAAMALCRSDTSINMVITDIDLGGAASGWDVAECCRTTRPDVSVIYTSGKSLDSRRPVLGSAFVPKPYHNGDVLKACRRLIAGTGRGAAEC
jgi:CheY-like chemotaxis protein